MGSFHRWRFDQFGWIVGPSHVQGLAKPLAHVCLRVLLAVSRTHHLTMTASPLDPVAFDVGVVSEAKDYIAVDGGLHAASIAAGANLDRSFARGIAWQGSVKWIVQLVTWATTIFVARILSPEDYGLLAMGA